MCFVLALFQHVPHEIGCPGAQESPASPRPAPRGQAGTRDFKPEYLEFRNAWCHVQCHVAVPAQVSSLPNTRVLWSLTVFAVSIYCTKYYCSSVFLINTVWIVWIYACIHLYIYIFLDRHTYIHTYTHTYIHAYIHTYIYIYRLDICELRTKNVLISSNDVLCDSANITTGSADYSRGASGQIETMHMACASSRAALAALS